MRFPLPLFSALVPRPARSAGSTYSMKTAGALVGSLVVAVVVLLLAQQVATGAPLGDEDDRARELIEQVAKTYRALPVYVERGHLSTVTRFRGKQHGRTVPVSVAFSRPNRLALRSATTELVCDGQRLSIAWVPLGRFISIKAPEAISLSTFTRRMDEVTRMVALSGDELHFPFILALLSGDPQATQIFRSGGAGPVVEPDRKIGGKTLHSLLVERRGESKLRFLIESDTKLVTQIQEIYPLAQADLARRDAEDPPRHWIIEKSWSASSIETKAAPANLFTYSPSRNFKRVGNFKRAVLLAEAMSVQPLLNLLGSPAPDFLLNVVDNVGSSRKVSKADLAGKVIVIAYWSIHHEPCFDELRQIRKTIQASSPLDKVVLVALNVDEGPEDVKESGARARRTLTEKNVGIEESRACMVAVDPSGAIAEILPVAGLPAIVLLDGKGIVQSSHSGTGQELTGALRNEIETLLAGKSLDRPELKLPAGFDADESKPTLLTEDTGAR